MKENFIRCKYCDVHCLNGCETREYTKNYRSEEIRKAYLDTGMFKPELFDIGDQISYEMEKDLNTMTEAIQQIEMGLGTVNLENHVRYALKLLVKRIAKYSCPSRLKEEYKTKERCPLGNRCTCVKS